MAKRIAIYFLSMLLIFLYSCKNPLEEEKKKELIREYYYTQAPVGRYNLYWDGQNKGGKYVSNGEYIILMEVKDFQDQITVTAIEGGKPLANDDGDLYFNEIYHDHELLVPKPDPFRVKEGVNIPFIVGGTPGSVKISIYKD